MINGCAPIGVYPNQALGLPITRDAKDAVVKLRPKFNVRTSLIAKFAAKVKRLPKT